MMPVSFDVSAELHDQLEETAKECGTSVSAVCRLAVQSFLSQLETDCRLEREKPICYVCHGTDKYCGLCNGQSRVEEAE
jgi:hypothetical protein